MYVPGIQVNVCTGMQVNVCTGMQVNVCTGMQVNGQSLLGTSHHEAVHALQNLGTTVTLLVCDGYNGCNVTAGKPASGLSTQVCRKLSMIGIITNSC